MSNAIPQKVVIMGIGKTGTTALFSKITTSPIFHDFKNIFEPHNQENLAEVLDTINHTEKIIIKDVFITTHETHYDIYDSFDKKILIIRDPRDVLISGVLYALGDKTFKEVLVEKQQSILDILRKKRKSPTNYSVGKLYFDIHSQLKGGPPHPDAIFRYIAELYQKYLHFLETHPDWFIIKYEDMIDKKFESLEQYLGYPINAQSEVDTDLQRVVRSKSYGDWKNWLTPEDIALSKQLFNPILEKLQYDTTWELHDKQIILLEHCEEYIARLWKTWTFL